MPEQSFADKPGRESPELLAARVRLLYENGKSANIAVLLVVPVLAAMLHSFFPSWLMLCWLLFMAGLVGVRLMLVRYRTRDGNRLKDEQWLQLYVSTTALVGIGWAAVPIWLMPEHSPPHQILVIVLVIGIASAGIAVLHSSLAAMMLYTVPALAALIGKLLWIGWVDAPGYWMAGLLLMLAYPLTHVRTALNTHRAVIESLRLDEQNRQLVQQLQAEVGERRSAQRALENNQQHLETLVALRTAELEREVAERQLAQHDAEMAAEAAERANQAKSEFLANMSHELRTPMHAILSFAEMGHKRVTQLPPDKLATYFERIGTSGERLMHLLNDLLDLARLEAGKVQLLHSRTSVKSLLDCLCVEMAPLAAQRDIRLLRPDGDEAQTLVIDESRMLQVLRNLTANAIKFAPEHSDITLHCRVGTLSGEDGASRPALQISVGDRGPGIPEAELQRIFERFTQSSTTRTGAGGSGLGLAICREIVELHGGTLQASNRTGGGAEFHLRLPLPAPDEQTN